MCFASTPVHETHTTLSASAVLTPVGRHGRGVRISHFSLSKRCFRRPRHPDRSGSKAIRIDVKVIGISIIKYYAGIADSHSILAFILLFEAHFRVFTVFTGVTYRERGRVLHVDIN